PLQFEDFMIKVMIGEDAYGHRHTEEAVLVWNSDRAQPDEPLGRPELDVTWIEGTREMERARLTFAAAPERTATIPPLRTVYLSAGSGYSYDGEWGHGVYQGPLVVQGLVQPIGDPPARRDLSGLNDTLCRFELDGGEVGYGLHENMVLGAHL